MKCPICGMIREERALRCPRCGHDPTREIRQVFCPECGTPMPRQAKVCLMCGQTVVSSPQKRPPLRVPLPKWSWLPVPLPSSVQLSVVLGMLVCLVMGVSVLRFAWPFLFLPALKVSAVLTSTASPTALAMPTPTATMTPTSTPTATPSPTNSPTPLYYVVTAGDSPASIASRFGLSIEQLMAANGVRDPRSLQPGQSLLIPQARGEDAPTPTPIIYKVQPGDTLSSIAIWAGTTVEEIMKLNNLKNPRWLSVGQTLFVPASSERIEPTPMPNVEVTVAVRIVEPGDTLLALALQYHTSVRAIKEANHIEDEEFIRVGDSLVIPVGPGEPTPSPTPLPTNTPTPGPQYPAPDPLSPPNGHHFWADSEPVLLNWTSVGILGNNDWYVVELRYQCGTVETVRYGWTRSTSWHVPPSVCPQPAPTHRLYKWRVWVAQSPMPDAEPRSAEALSPPSAERQFYR